jgi:hypothetical protein
VPKKLSSAHLQKDGPSAMLPDRDLVRRGPSHQRPPTTMSSLTMSPLCARRGGGEVGIANDCRQCTKESRQFKRSKFVPEIGAAALPSFSLQRLAVG